MGVIAYSKVKSSVCMWSVGVGVSVCVSIYSGKVQSLFCLLPVSLETDCKKASL